MKQITSLKIDRSRWGTDFLHNGPDLETVDQKNRMCCLGFCARKMGVKVRDIIGASLLSDLDEMVLSQVENETDGRAPSRALGLTFAMQTRIARVNDSDNLTRREKEKQLKALFKEAGIKLSFYGRGGKGAP